MNRIDVMEGHHAGLEHDIDRLDVGHLVYSNGLPQVDVITLSEFMRVQLPGLV